MLLPVHVLHKDWFTDGEGVQVEYSISVSEHNEVGIISAPAQGDILT